jgi:hypothetical protein
MDEAAPYHTLGIEAASSQLKKQIEEIPKDIFFLFFQKPMIRGNKSKLRQIKIELYLISNSTFLL